MSIRVVPVIDLKGDRAVHAVGGLRDQYQPLRTIWQADPHPERLASHSARRVESEHPVSRRSGCDWGMPSAYRCVSTTRRAGSGLVDRCRPASRARLGSVARSRQPQFECRGRPGKRDEPTRSRGHRRSGRNRPHDLQPRPVRRTSADRARSGLEDGRPDPRSRAARSSEGVRRLIILDLARVGTGRGPGTRGILDGIRQTLPHVEIIVGGGISDVEEIRELREAGATAVLVGSAIYEGRIGRRELEWIAGNDRRA